MFNHIGIGIFTVNVFSLVVSPLQAHRVPGNISQSHAHVQFKALRLYVSSAYLSQQGIHQSTCLKESSVSRDIHKFNNQVTMKSNNFRCFVFYYGKQI